MLRRAPNFAVGNWGSTDAGFTLRTGLAELIYLHPFGPFRFSDMLLSPSGFPSRLAGCPRRCLRSRPPAPGGQSHVRRNGAPQLSGWHRMGRWYVKLGGKKGNYLDSIKLSSIIHVNSHYCCGYFSSP